MCCSSRGAASQREQRVLAHRPALIRSRSSWGIIKRDRLKSICLIIVFFLSRSGGSHARRSVGLCRLSGRLYLETRKVSLPVPCHGIEACCPHAQPSTGLPARPGGKMSLLCGRVPRLGWVGRPPRRGSTARGPAWWSCRATRIVWYLPAVVPGSTAHYVIPDRHSRLWAQRRASQAAQEHRIVVRLEGSLAWLGDTSPGRGGSSTTRQIARHGVRWICYMMIRDLLCLLTPALRLAIWNCAVWIPACPPRA